MSQIPFGRIFNSEPLWCRTSAVALTGSTDATELARVLIPGNFVGPNGDLNIDFIFTSTAVDDQTLDIALGNAGDPNTIFTATVSAAGSANHRITLTNRGDTTAQICMVDGATTKSELSIDTGAEMILTVTGTLADDTDTLTLQKICVSTLFRADT